MHAGVIAWTIQTVPVFLPLTLVYDLEPGSLLHTLSQSGEHLYKVNNSGKLRLWSMLAHIFLH